MKLINPPDDVKPSGPYSLAICAAHLLFTSGRIGIDPSRDKLIDGGLEFEIRQIINNLSISLTEVKLTISDVIKATVYLHKSETIERFFEIFSKYFEKSNLACTVVQVDWLPENALVQIEFIAVLPKEL